MKHKQNYKVFQLNNAKNMNQQEIPKKTNKIRTTKILLKKETTNETHQ